MTQSIDTSQTLTRPHGAELDRSKTDAPFLRSGALQRAFEALEKFFLSRHFAYSLAGGGAVVLCLSFPLALLALKIGFFKTLLVAGGVLLGSAAAFRIHLPFVLKPNPAPRPTEIEMRPVSRRGPRPPEELPNPSYPFPKNYVVVEAPPRHKNGKPLRILLRLAYDPQKEEYSLSKNQRNRLPEGFTLNRSFYYQTHLLSRFFIHARNFQKIN